MSCVLAITPEDKSIEVFRHPFRGALKIAAEGLL